MSYPGNPSLSPAVKDRVLSTFQQAVVLFKQGRNDEVSAGCNLLLQMDPMFEPARKLLEKLRNPALPIDVDQLVPLERTGPSPMEQARAAMAAREFERVVQITSEILTNDLFNDEARVLGDDAREKLEAGPFIDQFTRKADQHLAAGNAAAARAEVEKARSLDPTHPDVMRVTRALADAPAVPVPAQPSFVVDDSTASAPGGGRTAHAADFGFTFEEEKPEKPAEVSFTNFSFDTPAAESPFGGFSFDAQPGGHAPAAPAPAPAPAPAEHFDFATASVTASDEDQKKIEQYLSDGDRAFDSGDYSQAIDLWSRIFLIDVTNDQASERIERAKEKRRELEQKAETMLTSAVAAFDRGDKAKARTELTEILRLDPRNATAQDYLDRLEESPAAAGAPAGQPMVPPPAEKHDIFDDDFGAFGNETSAPATPIPSPSTRETKPKAAPAPAPARKLPTRLIAIVVGLLVLGAGGWFAWSKFSAGTETESSGAGQALLARATLLANQGRYDQAIALLRDIQPGDPAHDKALVLIADLQQKKSTSAALIDGMPAAQYFDQKIAAAKAALSANDFSAAKAAFEQATRVRPLPPDLKAQYDLATQQASKLDASRALFSERKYADALASLEPLLAQDPGNPGIQRMIADAHFNLGAMALQEERIPDAIREFDETLKVNPNDELARRSRDLAARYKDEAKDLLYKIYVKYLPLRQAT